jgi:hypothetical protein
MKVVMGFDATGVIFGVFVVECELMRTAKLSLVGTLFPPFSRFSLEEIKFHDVSRPGILDLLFSQNFIPEKEIP